jgi:hypothetical protein
MDSHPLPPDDVNELERRLVGWKPSEAGLTAEAMLFAAGRASARPGGGRFVWPVVSGCLALVCVSLGTWAQSERSQRLALLQEIRQPLAQSAPASEVTPESMPSAPDAYLILRRDWEQHPGRWEVSPEAPGQAPKAPAAPERPVLRAWQPNGPAEPL